MIKTVRISNFKSIEELELDLGHLNVLIGENGCGKTNILEAIAFGSAGTDGEGTLLDTFASVRGVRISEPHLMKSAFRKISKEEVNKGYSNFTSHIVTNIGFENKDEELLEVKIGTHRENQWATHIDYRNLGKKNSEFLQKFRKKQIQSLEKEGYILHRETSLIKQLFNGADLSSFNIYCPENFFLRRFEEEGQIKPLGIRGEGLFKHLVDLHKEHPELLYKISQKLQLIDWFQGFEIPKDLMFTEKRINIKDRFLNDLDYFDQRSANEGFLYLLFYFTLFISPNTPSFFAIDNIDNALNPKLCARLIQELSLLAKEHHKQVILTTHNPAILDGLSLNGDNSQRLFTIYRNADGATHARRIIPKKTPVGVESVRLSEAYIRGYLGGLPQNF